MVNSRTRIKVCGITRMHDALAACALGIDAVGLVFTRRSRRFIEPAQARTIRRALPPFVTVVALFMDDEQAWIDAVIGAVEPDVLQFHGGESAAVASSSARPYLKAVPMGSGVDARAQAEAHPDALALLLDGHAAGEAGGSGMPFDWSRVPRIERPIVLAGGLDPSNVARAVELVRPFAVDVSSGIESAPGIKDAERMRAFVAAVHAADRNRPDA